MFALFLVVEVEEKERTTFGRGWQLWKPALTMADFSTFQFYENYTIDITIFFVLFVYQNRKDPTTNLKTKLKEKCFKPF